MKIKIDKIQELTEREVYIISMMANIMYTNNGAGHEIVDSFILNPEIKNLLERNLSPMQLERYTKERGNKNGK